jgi:hypothetical protein
VCGLRCEILLIQCGAAQPDNNTSWSAIEILTGLHSLRVCRRLKQVSVPNLRIFRVHLISTQTSKQILNWSLWGNATSSGSLVAEVNVRNLASVNCVDRNIAMNKLEHLITSIWLWNFKQGWCDLKFYKYLLLYCTGVRKNDYKNWKKNPLGFPRRKSNSRRDQADFFPIFITVFLDTL